MGPHIVKLSQNVKYNAKSKNINAIRHMFHTKKDSKRKRGVSQNVNKITIQGCVSQCVVKYVVSLTQCILNGDFNARQANDGCETHPWVFLRFVVHVIGLQNVNRNIACRASSISVLTIMQRPLD